MAKEMLINTVEGKECRIAIVQDSSLEELYQERASSASRVGNIYKGRVTNVESAIQAAFIDFGSAKNGFLHISDLHPKHFPHKDKGNDPVGQKRGFRDRPPIQECLRRGQEVVVQMTKEGIGTKGPTLTTYLSIPGRLLVMMPGMSKMGVSRKIEDEKARDKLRKILDELQPRQDIGFIVRTAGANGTKREIQRDLNFLTRLWTQVSQRIKAVRAPADIYKESDLVMRTLRDVYDADIERVLCDSESVARRVKEFLDVAMPRSKHEIRVYRGREGLFHETGIEAEIERIYHRRVEMPSGGSLIIDQAEALVAIDVNSGRFRDHSDAETTALKINLEAAKEICRQLRLRDLGGVVIMDFIDMREEKNRRAVEKAMRNEIKRDRARTRMLKISAFGVIEMTRQRVRASLEAHMYRRCAACDGAGQVKSEESLSLAALRALQRAANHDEVAHIELRVTPPVAHYISNFLRREITRLEEATGTSVLIQADASLPANDMAVTCTHSRGTPVAWDQHPTTRRRIADLASQDIEEVLATEQARAATPEPPDADAKSVAKADQAIQPDSREAGIPVLDETDDQDEEPAETKDEAQAEEKGEEKKPRRRRSRRGRRGRGKKATTEGEAQAPAAEDQGEEKAPPAEKPAETTEAAKEPPKQSAKEAPKSTSKESAKDAPPPEPKAEEKEAKPAEGEAGEEQKDAKRRRRRRRPRRKAATAAADADAAPPVDGEAMPDYPADEPDELIPS